MKRLALESSGVRWGIFKPIFFFLVFFELFCLDEGKVFVDRGGGEGGKEGSCVLFFSFLSLFLDF